MTDFKLVNGELVLFDQSTDTAQVIFNTKELNGLKFLIKKYMK